jgi:hypothetical protein
MATTLRQFIQDKANTSQDVTVGLILSAAGTDGEVYVLETDPLNPTLPASFTLSTPTIRQFAINNSTTTNITTGAYVQLIASTTNTTTEIEILDTGGRWYHLATGAAASETNILLIPPGGNGRIPVGIAAGTRLSVRAIDGTANAGYLGVNLYG